MALTEMDELEERLQGCVEEVMAGKRKERRWK